MRALIACEWSGSVRQALQARPGWEVWSCDLKCSSDGCIFHVVGDVRPLLRETWDLVIAHPPCEKLANVAERWRKRAGAREEFEAAAELFEACLAANARCVAVENSQPGRWALERFGRYDQAVHPWHFGDNRKKRTCLWLRGLPLLERSGRLTGKTARQWIEGVPGGPLQAERRSMVSPAMCRAMAAQWGAHVEGLRD